MNHTDEFPVEKMCKVFGVSRSGYYAWRKERFSETQKHDDLDQQIRSVFEQSGRTYGSPRITQALHERYIEVSESTVARRMKVLKIRVKAPKKYVVTTQSKHDEPVAPNRLNRDFTADAPATKWVGDITYFRVAGKWHYLTSVIDLADRYVVGWTISDQMSAATTTQAAFRQAIASRPPKKGLLFHSDRGVQYACGDFRRLLAEYKCEQSMSRKGNCWDNAVAESFFKTLKAECISRYTFNSVEEAYSVIFRYIEGWYNTRRIHSALGGISPTKMYQKLTRLKTAA